MPAARVGLTRAALAGRARELGLTDEGSAVELEAAIGARERELDEKIEKIGDIELRVGTWHGRPNYRCPFCSFASLRKRLAIVHVADVHLTDAGNLEGQG